MWHTLSSIFANASFRAFSSSYTADSSSVSAPASVDSSAAVDIEEDASEDGEVFSGERVLARIVASSSAAWRISSAIVVYGVLSILTPSFLFKGFSDQS